MKSHAAISQFVLQARLNAILHGYIAVCWLYGYNTNMLLAVLKFKFSIFSKTLVLNIL